MDVIFDSDRHVVEPNSIWRDYVNIKSLKNNNICLSHYQQLANGELSQVLTIDGKPIYKHWYKELDKAFNVEVNTCRSNYLNAKNPNGQLASMDINNVGIASLFPTAAMYIVNHSQISTEESVLYADAYNRWLFDYCSTEVNRLNAVGVISRHDPNNMLQQLTKIHNEFQWQTVTLRPEVIASRIIGHHDYEEFWQAAESMDIGIAFHGGTHLYGPTVGSERFSSRFALHACSHVMEAQMCFLSLLESGVLERYPKLKIAFLETGASWLPSWLWRLDNICYPEYSTLVKQNIKMLPSEYFKRQCWIGLEIGEPLLQETAAYIGHDRLLFGSDYPHLDHANLGCSKELLHGFSEQEKQDIFYNNALCFYGRDNSLTKGSRG